MRFLLTKFLLAIVFSALPSREIFGNSVVVPKEFQNTNGSISLAHLSQAVEIQHIFVLDSFPGGSPILITAVAFRVDDRSAFSRSYDAVVPRVQIKMSTFFKPVSEASQFYNDNRGVDEIVVFDAQNLHLTGRYIPNAVNPFDLKLQLSTPFVFNPESGHLLMYWKSEEGSGGIPGSQAIDAHMYNGGDGPGPVLSSLADGSSPLRYITPIFSFEYTQVPEPSIWLLLGISLLPLVRRLTR
jgi:hypothetical protein